MRCVLIEHTLVNEVVSCLVGLTTVADGVTIFPDRLETVIATTEHCVDDVL